MKRLLFFVLVLAITGYLLAEGNPSLTEALISEAAKTNEKLKQEPGGIKAVFLALSNPFADPEGFSIEWIPKIETILKRNGITILDSEIARRTVGIRASDFITDEEAVKKFCLLPVDLIILAKVDEAGRFYFAVGKNEEGGWSFEWDNDPSNEGIQVEIDDSFFRLLYGIQLPRPPRASGTSFTAEILALKYSPDGHLFVADAAGRVTKNVGTRKIVFETGKVVAIDFNSTNEALLAGERGIAILSGKNIQIINDSPATGVVAMNSGIIIVGFEGRIALLDSTGKEFYSLKDVTGDPRNLMLSNDELFLYGCDERGLGKWSTSSGQRVATVIGSFSSMTIDPRGIYVAASYTGTNTMEMFDMDLNKKNNIQFKPTNAENNPQITALTTSPSGIFLISADDQGIARTWLAARGGSEIHIISDHYAAVNVIAHNPKGNQIASGGDDCIVNIFQYAEPMGTLVIENKTQAAVGIRLDRNLITIPVGGTRLPLAMGNHNAQIITPAGTVFGSGNSGNTNFSIAQNKSYEISINHYAGALDAESKNRLETRAIAVFGGNIIVGQGGTIPEQTGGRVAPVSVWSSSGIYSEFGNREQQHRSHINAVVVSSDGITYTGSDDTTAKAWQGQGLLQTVNHGSKVVGVDVFNDFLLTTSHDTTKIWNRKTFQQIRSIDGGKAIFQHDSSVLVVRGNTLSRVSSGNEQLSVFPLEIDNSSQEIVFLESIQCLKRGEQGSVFVMLNGTVQMRNRNASVPLIFPGTCAAQRGNMLAVGKENGSIELRDTSTGLITSVLALHDKAVTAIEFLNDNQIASIAKDHVLRITNIRTLNTILRCYRYSDGQHVALTSRDTFIGDFFPVLVWRGGRFQPIDSSQVNQYRER
jgi:WD40 repeat protein